jgi:hypothetical protein
MTAGVFIGSVLRYNAHALLRAAPAIDSATSGEPDRGTVRRELSAQQSEVKKGLP